MNILLFEDMQISIFTKKIEDVIHLEPELLRDGEIVDMNYLFYLMKKKIEKLSLKKCVFVISSSKFLKVKLNTTGIKNDELVSFVNYELREFTNIEDYRYVYRKEGDFALVNLINNNFIEDYMELAKHLKIELFGIYHTVDSLKKSNYINHSVNHLQLIEEDEDEIIFLDFSKFLEKSGINHEDFENIVLGKFAGVDSDKLKKIEKMINFQKFENEKWLKKKMRAENYIYFGDFPFEFEKSFRKLTYSDFELKNNFIEKKKISYFQVAAVILFLILNILFYSQLKTREIREMDQLNAEISRQEEILKDKLKNNSSINTREEEKFEELVIKFENFSNDDILFKEYKFFDDKVRINGIADSTEILETAMKLYESTEIIFSQIAEDDIEFEIEIDLRFIDENR